MLNRMVKSCKACQIHSRPPQRFRFVLHNEKRFNHVILADAMKFYYGHVVHIMCESTSYQLGAFLTEVSSQSCWDVLSTCWINVQSGSTYIIRTNAGRQFTGKVFRDNANACGIHVEVVATEAHNKIGLLERYHDDLRRVNEKLKIDDPSIETGVRLSNAFRFVNASAGPDGLVPKLLVLGAFPKLGLKLELMAPNTIERAIAIREATELAESLTRKERLRRAAIRGPTANMEIIGKVKKLHREEPVLVYR